MSNLSNLKLFVKSCREAGMIVVDDFRKASVREDLSEEETRSAALELARANRSVTEKKAEIADTSKQMKSELATVEAKVEELSTLLNNGYRRVMKPVVVIADFVRRARILLDPETGAEVGTELLAENDYQMKANLTPPEPPVMDPPPAPPAPIQLEHDGTVKLPVDVTEAEYTVVEE
jgi:hypothetical protein